METELISSQIATAYVISSLLEWLKGKPWFPFMKMDTSNLNRAFAVIVAFITAVGVHWVADWEATSGVLTLKISGLNWRSVGHGAVAWIQQMAFQQGTYKLLVKPNGVKRN